MDFPHFIFLKARHMFDPKDSMTPDIDDAWDMTSQDHQEDRGDQGLKHLYHVGQRSRGYTQATNSKYDKFLFKKKQLLSMKECSGKKLLIVKVAQNDPLDSSSQKIDQVDSKIKDVR